VAAAVSSSLAVAASPSGACRFLKAAGEEGGGTLCFLAAGGRAAVSSSSSLWCQVVDDGVGVGGLSLPRGSRGRDSLVLGGKGGCGGGSALVVVAAD
jgi:hypothetical protein